MLELGDDADALHAGLKGDLEAAGVDLVFAAGPHMRALYDALTPNVRGAHAENSDGLISAVLGAVHPGDVVLVKGSLGSRMAPVVEALLGLGRPPAQAVNG
jgi:UDP-N-acetylmuramoyl-tripeptide--D-alanyl-D-alanine ligase